MILMTMGSVTAEHALEIFSLYRFAHIIIHSCLEAHLTILFLVAACNGDDFYASIVPAMAYGFGCLKAIHLGHLYVH